MNIRFTMIIAVCWLSTIFLGCAAIKDVGKGFAGVSTRVLEDKRKDALKKSFALGYDNCYKKVKDILARGDSGPYIYAEDSRKKMIAIYFSPADTTPVGIFFTQEAADRTLVEVSSPSIYAKEEIAKIIWTGIDALIKPKIEEKADVEKKVGNQ